MADHISSDACDTTDELCEQVERWRNAATRLTADSDKNAKLTGSRRAFARVMQDALGSLLLNGGGDDLRSIEYLTRKK